jgi:hypothetical protein
MWNEFQNWTLVGINVGILDYHHKSDDEDQLSITWEQNMEKYKYDTSNQHYIKFLEFC